MPVAPFEELRKRTIVPGFDELRGKTASPAIPSAEIVRLQQETGVNVGTLTDMYAKVSMANDPDDVSPYDARKKGSLSIVADAAQALKETPGNLYIGGMMFSEGILDAVQWHADQFEAGANAQKAAWEKTFNLPPEGTVKGELARMAIPGQYGIQPWVVGLANKGADWLNARAKARMDAQMRATLENAPITKFARLLTQQGIPPAGVAIGLSLATGSPAAGLVSFFESSGGQSYREQREAGGNFDKANLIATLSGAAEVGGELLVFPKFVRGLTKGIPLRNAIALVAENAGQEGVTQFTQTFVGEVGKMTSAGVPIEEAATKAYDMAWDAAKEAAVVGGLTAGVLDVASLPATIYKTAKQVQTEQGVVNAEAKPTVQPENPAPAPGSAEEIWQKLTGPEKLVAANDSERELKEAYEVGILGSPQDVAQWMGMKAEPAAEGVPAPQLPLQTPVAPVAGTGPYEAGVETGLVRERAFVTHLKDVGILSKDVTAEYRQRETEPLAIKASNLVRDDIDRAESIARSRVDDAAVATTVELLKHYNRERVAATDDAVRNAMTDKINELVEKVAPKYTEAGRTIQALSILNLQTPEGQLRFAAKTIDKYNQTHRKKLPNLTREQSDYILDEMAAIGKLPNGKEKAIRYRGLQDYIGALAPSTFYQKAVTLWKAGLLTGIKTSGLNTIANGMHGITETTKDIVAAPVDSVLSLFTGKRTLVATPRGSLAGLKEGFEHGWTYLRTGYNDRDAALKYDWKKVNFGKSKFARSLQAYEETVFRILGSEDYPFYYAAKARSITGQAMAMARNEKLEGKAFDARVDELVANPNDEMIKYAVIDAETAVFANRTMLGDIAKQIQKAPGGEIVIPFGRTPSAIAMQIVNYSPVGAVKSIVENIANFDQRTFAQELGRAGLGTGIMWVGAELFKAGLLTLSRPEGEKEKELWKLEGRSANSIKVGDQWRSIQVFGPAGVTLLIGGYFAQALEKTGSPSRAITVALSGGAKSFSEQTFVRGVNMAVDALTDPERSFDTFVTSMAGSVVPTIVADIARASDTVERRTAGPLQRIESRIPGARQTLEPDITVFGQDLPRYGGNVLEVMLDPTRPSKIRQDMVVDELRRLWDAGHKPSPTKLGDRLGYKALTPEQNTQLWRRAGEMTYVGIWEVITDPLYQSADDEEKSRYIDRSVENAKLIARAEMAFSLLDGLPEDKREVELKRLRDGGLVVNAVERVLQTLY